MASHTARRMSSDRRFVVLRGAWTLEAADENKGLPADTLTGALVVVVREPDRGSVVS